MSYSTRNNSGRNHYEGSFESKGYNHKTFDLNENMINDPLAKSYAIREAFHLGIDEVIAFVSKDQLNHALWPQAEKVMRDAAIKAGKMDCLVFKQQEESKENGFYDLMLIEDGEVVAKQDVGIRNDWQNADGVIKQRMDDGQIYETTIVNKWMACVGNNMFPFDKPNFWARKFLKVGVKDHPTEIIEYAFDGSRSYRISYEKGLQYVPVNCDKRNNHGDASIQPPISEVQFHEWRGDELFEYRPVLLTPEALRLYVKAQIAANIGKHVNLSRNRRK